MSDISGPPYIFIKSWQSYMAQLQLIFGNQAQLASGDQTAWQLTKGDKNEMDQQSTPSLTPKQFFYYLH